MSDTCFICKELLSDGDLVEVRRVSDSDSSKSASEQLLAKKAKLYNDTLSSESNQQRFLCETESKKPEARRAPALLGPCKNAAPPGVQFLNFPKLYQLRAVGKHKPSLQSADEFKKTNDCDKCHDISMLEPMSRLSKIKILWCK
ncbi:hypothetical protein PV328_001064 [Microctonus aethiopoides]|uniref:Uncharacterized protein n=1 Tax=Microctonus aethiopoides TaxID=144406 RepID=A0AA39KX85_9HYME|nr:hypothetical protein PV328_001064 [Microctonus aethiopoides]